MNAAPSTPNTSGDPSCTGTAAANAPFLGTPYIIDMQRPYEYPFPSPATESCPSLLLPYSHGHPGMGGIGHGPAQHPNAPYPQPLQLTHPFPPSYTSTSSSGSTSTASSVTSSTPPSTSSSLLVHRTHSNNSDIHAVPNGYGYSHYNHHGASGSSSSAAPYPSTSGVHPPISFRPTTLLRRRSSSHETHHNLIGLSPTASVPIPPRLLGRERDFSLGGGGVGNANGRWRKGRRSGSDGSGASVK